MHTLNSTTLQRRNKKKQRKLQKATKESEWFLLVWSKSKQTKYNAQQQTVFI